jgi:hypothetical protein
MAAGAEGASANVVRAREVATTAARAAARISSPGRGPISSGHGNPRVHTANDEALSQPSGIEHETRGMVQLIDREPIQETRRSGSSASRISSRFAKHSMTSSLVRCSGPDRDRLRRPSRRPLPDRARPRRHPSLRGAQALIRLLPRGGAGIAWTDVRGPTRSRSRALGTKEAAHKAVPPRPWRGGRRRTPPLPLDGLAPDRLERGLRPSPAALGRDSRPWGRVRLVDRATDRLQDGAGRVQRHPNHRSDHKQERECADPCWQRHIPHRGNRSTAHTRPPRPTSTPMARTASSASTRSADLSSHRPQGSVRRARVAGFRVHGKEMERKTGLEPATLTLAR